MKHHKEHQKEKHKKHHGEHREMALKAKIAHDRSEKHSKSK